MSTAAGRRVRLVQLPLGVGGADDPVPLPRDHEQHAAFGPRDQAHRGVDAVARHHQVHALGRAHVELPALPDQRLGLVGPDPGGVDDLAGPHLPFGAGLGVAHRGSDDPLALAQEPDHLHPGRAVRPVGGGGAHQAHHEPGIVDLRVPVLDRADVAVGTQRGHQAPGLTTGQVTVSRDAGTARRRSWRTSRRARCRRRRRPVPIRGGSAGRGTAPGAPGAARAR